jgi:hypothetical protein
MFEEKMKLQPDKIERLMTRLNWTPRVFADVIKVEMPEAYKLLISAEFCTKHNKRFVKKRQRGVMGLRAFVRKNLDNIHKKPNKSAARSPQKLMQLRVKNAQKDEQDKGVMHFGLCPRVSPEVTATGTPRSIFFF